MVRANVPPVCAAAPSAQTLNGRWGRAGLCRSCGRSNAETVCVEFCRWIMRGPEEASQVAETAPSREGASIREAKQRCPLMVWDWTPVGRVARHSSEGAEWSAHPGDVNGMSLEELICFGVAEVEGIVGGCPVKIHQGGMDAGVKEA